MTRFTKTLTVRPNPNLRAPLSALASFSTAEPVRGTIEVFDGKRTRRSSVPIEANLDRSIPVAGMRPGRVNVITLRLQTLNGTELPESCCEYSPPPLNRSYTDLPSIKIKTSLPGSMEPGLLVLSIRRRPAQRAIWWTEKQFAFANRWSILLALDEDGEIVWLYEHDSRIAGIDQLPNGNIFFHQVNFQSSEIDPLGDVKGSWYASKRPFGPAPGAIPIDAQSMHHQPYIMPNGNFLAMTANARTFENYYSSDTDPDAPRKTANVVGDRVIEFDRDGTIIWSWNTFDHLDPYRIGYQTWEPYWDTRGFRDHADWTHGNGLCYDSRDDSFLISLRVQDAIIKVMRKTGEIKWILGPHDGWGEQFKSKLLSPVGRFQWPWHAHNPRLTPDGTIVIYDNSMFHARPFSPPRSPYECFSRGVEFAVDETKMEVREVWSSDNPNGADRLLSWAMGDAHRLEETDNMLVIDSFCFPQSDPIDKLGHIRRADLQWDEWDRSKWHPSDFAYWARIREYQRSADKKIVFEAIFEDPHDIMGWEVFGGFKTRAFGEHV